jgi:hypothetical protein
MAPPSLSNLDCENGVLSSDQSYLFCPVDSSPQLIVARIPIRSSMESSATQAQSQRSTSAVDDAIMVYPPGFGNQFAASGVAVDAKYLYTLSQVAVGSGPYGPSSYVQMLTRVPLHRFGDVSALETITVTDPTHVSGRTQFLTLADNSERLIGVLFDETLGLYSLYSFATATFSQETNIAKVYTGGQCFDIVHPFTLSVDSHYLYFVCKGWTMYEVHTASLNQTRTLRGPDGSGSYGVMGMYVHPSGRSLYLSTHVYASNLYGLTRVDLPTFRVNGSTLTLSASIIEGPAILPDPADPDVLFVGGFTVSRWDVRDLNKPPVFGQAWTIANMAWVQPGRAFYLTQLGTAMYACPGGVAYLLSFPPTAPSASYIQASIDYTPGGLTNPPYLGYCSGVDTKQRYAYVCDAVTSSSGSLYSTNILRLDLMAGAGAPPKLTSVLPFGMYTASVSVNTLVIDDQSVNVLYFAGASNTQSVWRCDLASFDKSPPQAKCISVRMPSGPVSCIVLNAARSELYVSSSSSPSVYVVSTTASIFAVVGTETFHDLDESFNVTGILSMTMNANGSNILGVALTRDSRSIYTAVVMDITSDAGGRWQPVAHAQASVTQGAITKVESAVLHRATNQVFVHVTSGIVSSMAVISANDGKTSYVSSGYSNWAWQGPAFFDAAQEFLYVGSVQNPAVGQYSILPPYTLTTVFSYTGASTGFVQPSTGNLFFVSDNGRLIEALP